ncbi:MAG: FKBP-type peptidyl-prolyl cis-trans isomerase [Hymenobacteraceae bacterium]|nr:FKBP-type peptidyl-prolyl cis-trans isomerase [Hymenobacteraceae bacterium]
MSLYPLIQWTAKKDNLLRALLLFVIAVSFAACEKQEFPRSICRPTESEKMTQKEADIKVIKKYFRENNIDTSSMQVTASGIHYFNLTQGTGAKANLGDVVEVHYLGKYLDGPTFNSSTTFDSSYGGAKPFTVSIGAGGVIAGWEEALQLMKVGEESRFYIPSYLAYGPCGRGSIGPNEVLVFDIKLLRKL